MLINNLNSIMKQRNIKVSVLSLRTGISRNSLYPIIKNEVSMLQMDTIDKICQVLDVTPDDFFEYSPYNVSFDFEILDDGFEFHGDYVCSDCQGVVRVEKNNQEILLVEFDGYIDSLRIDMAPNEIYQFSCKINSDNYRELEDKFSNTMMLEVTNRFGSFIKNQLSQLNDGTIFKFNMKKDEFYFDIAQKQR